MGSTRRCMVPSIKSSINPPLNLYTSKSHGWLHTLRLGRLDPMGRPGHAPFESKTGNAQETYGLVKRGIETVHFPSSVKLQAPCMEMTGHKRYKHVGNWGNPNLMYLNRFGTWGSKLGRAFEGFLRRPPNLAFVCYLLSKFFVFKIIIPNAREFEGIQCEGIIILRRVYAGT